MLRQDAEVGVHSARFPLRIAAKNKYRARLWHEQPERSSDRRALARPVRPEQSVDLTFAERHPYIMQDNRTTDTEAELIDLNQHKFTVASTDRSRPLARHCVSYVG